MSLSESVERLLDLSDRECPESWIPTEEDALLIGEFVRLEQGQTVRGPAWIMILRTEDGCERSVWLLHTVLRNELARQRPRRGEVVLIRYDGRKANSAGQPYEAYQVLVDRQQPVPSWDAVAAAGAGGAEPADGVEAGAPF